MNEQAASSVQSKRRNLLFSTPPRGQSKILSIGGAAEGRSRISDNPSARECQLGGLAFDGGGGHRVIRDCLLSRTTTSAGEVKQYVPGFPGTA